MCSIEDPFDQDDWAGYQALLAKMGKDVQVCFVCSLSVLVVAHVSCSDCRR